MAATLAVRSTPKNRHLLSNGRTDDDLPLHISPQVTQTPQGETQHKTYSLSHGIQQTLRTSSSHSIPLTDNILVPATSTPVDDNISQFTLDSEVSFIPPVIRNLRCFNDVHTIDVNSPISMLPSRHLDSLLDTVTIQSSPDHTPSHLSGIEECKVQLNHPVSGGR